MSEELGKVVELSKKVGEKAKEIGSDVVDKTKEYAPVVGKNYNRV